MCVHTLAALPEPQPAANLLANAAASIIKPVQQAAYAAVVGTHAHNPSKPPSFNSLGQQTLACAPGMQTATCKDDPPGDKAGCSMTST